MSMGEAAIAGRSPRRRRNRRAAHVQSALDGSISAQAEEPRTGFELFDKGGVDLRAGGGTQQDVRHLWPELGRSPRRRRNL